MDSEYPNNSESQIIFHSVLWLFQLGSWRGVWGFFWSLLPITNDLANSSSSSLIIISFGCLLQNAAMENASLQQQGGGRELRCNCCITLTHIHRHMHVHSLFSSPFINWLYQYTWYIISVYSFWYITHFCLYSLFSAASENVRVEVEKGYNIGEILQAMLKGKSVWCLTLFSCQSWTDCLISCEQDNRLSCPHQQHDAGPAKHCMLVLAKHLAELHHLGLVCIAVIYKVGISYTTSTWQIYELKKKKKPCKIAGETCLKKCPPQNLTLPSSLKKILSAFLGCLHHRVPILPEYLSSGRVCPSREALYLEFSVCLESSQMLSHYHVCFSSVHTECNTAWFSLSLVDNSSWIECESESIQGKASSLLSGATQGLQQTSLSLTHPGQSLSLSKCYGFSIPQTLLFVHMKAFASLRQVSKQPRFLLCNT